MLTISTTGYFTYTCIWWSSFLSSFCNSFSQLIALLNHFVKAANTSVTLLWDFIFFIFCSFDGSELTCSEKVQSENFAVIRRKVPYLFSFSLCVLSILLPIKALSHSGIIFIVSLARISFVWFQLSLCWSCLMFFLSLLYKELWCWITLLLLIFRPKFFYDYYSAWNLAPESSIKEEGYITIRTFDYT